MTHPADPTSIARELLLARQQHRPVSPASWTIADAESGYAVQERTLDVLGPATAWKVGAKSPASPMSCSPLPSSGVLPSGAVLKGAQWQLRGIEVELAVRLRRDLDEADLDDTARLSSAIGEALPAIEVVETRLANWRESGPLEQLADLQNHGALVLGAPVPWSAIAPIDLRTLRATLVFDGQPVADSRGSHPVGDVLPLLAWLARHARDRGRSLRAGDVVTTGSCTGLLFAWEGARVQAEVEGIGRVELQF
ncbi:MAG: 2-keto-4-pentenoate hydratase [Ramlibacter sp.]